MQFLLEGVRVGESWLYVTLSETRREIEKVARGHGWDLSGIHICELIPSEGNLSADAQLTVFNPSELELGETTEAMIAAVDKYKPKRVVLDSLSELRLVAQNPLRYRRQILALKQFFSGRDCTVLMLDDCTGSPGDGQLESIAHGVVMLEQLANQYGAERRRLRVAKLRGVAFRGGYHDFAIRRGGLDVFPRLVAAEHLAEFPDGDLPSGNAQLDKLLCGGLPMGTSTLLMGPAGTGKSTVATQFAASAAKRGLRTAMYIFDENIGTFRLRSRKLGMDVEGPMRSELLTVQQVDPAELSSGEFAAIVRRAVEGTDGSKVTGQGGDCRQPQWLSQRDARGEISDRAAARVVGVSGAAGRRDADDGDAIGNGGEHAFAGGHNLSGRQCHSVSLFRSAGRGAAGDLGGQEAQRQTRDNDPRAEITEKGLEIGDPLHDFQGVLTGVPTYVGRPSDLIEKRGRMSSDAGRGTRKRILLLPPTQRDAEAIAQLLEQSDIECVPLATLRAVCEAIAEGAGAVIVSEEALASRRFGLAACIAEQPVWSDLPIVVLSRAGVESQTIGRLLGSLGQCDGAGAAGAVVDIS